MDVKFRELRRAKILYATEKTGENSEAALITRRALVQIRPPQPLKMESSLQKSSETERDLTPFFIVVSRLLRIWPMRHKFSNLLVCDHKQLQAPLFELSVSTGSASILFLKSVLRFIQCFILVGAMRTPFVVELHIFGNLFLEFVFRPVRALVKFFLLQRGEEGFHCAVVGRSVVSHGNRAEGFGRPGRYTGIHDRSGRLDLRRAFFFKGLIEDGGHQRGACPMSDFVGNHLSGIQIQDSADVVFFAALKAWTLNWRFRTLRVPWSFTHFL